MVLTPAKIHLQLEQFHDYYYGIQHHQQHVQSAPPRESMMVNEQADADDESDDWLALSILELKAPAHLPLPAHPQPPPSLQAKKKQRRRSKHRRRSTVSSPPAGTVPPDPSTALSVRGLHLGGGGRQQRSLR